MARRCCKYCGKPLPVNVTARCEYCPGGTCRKMAYKKRKAGKPPAPAAKPRAKPKRGPENQSLNSREFERMMDGKLEDVLRYNRDRLQKALDDPDTPASALPAISRQLIAVCRELEAQAAGDPLLDIEDEPMEVSEDAGASIV